MYTGHSINIVILKAYKIASLKIAPFKSPNKKLQKYNNNKKKIIHLAIVRGSQLTVGPKEFCIEVIKFEVVRHGCHFSKILLHFPVTDLFKQ